MVLLPLHLNNWGFAYGNSTTMDTDFVTGSLPGATGSWTVPLKNGFGTPKVIFMGVTDTESDDTARDDAVISFGSGKAPIGQSARQWCINCFSDHGVVTPKVYSDMRSGSDPTSAYSRIAVLMNNGGTPEVEVRLVSFADDRVNLRVETAAHTRGRYWLLAITGSNVDADVGSTTLASGKPGEAQSVQLQQSKVPTGVVCGYQTSLREPHINQSAAWSTRARMGIGFADITNSTVTQRGLAVSWGGDPGAGWSETSMGWFSRRVGETAEGTFKLSSVSSGRLWVTMEDVTTSDMDFCYTALYGVDCKADTQTMTGTGNTPVTGFNFKPYGFLFGNMIMRDGADLESQAVSNSRAGTFGLGAVDRGGDEGSCSASTENNVSPEDTQSLQDGAKAGNTPSHGGGTGQQWAITSVDEDGYTYGVTNQLSGNRNSIYLAFGVAPAVETPDATSTPEAWATISGPAAAHAVQSGAHAAQGAQSRTDASQASQSGSVSAQASQSGPEAAHAVQNND